MSGGRNNKARGYALEREAVLAAEAAGLEAKRVFASGAFKEQLGEDFAGDVVIEGLRCEMKRRKGGFRLLYSAFLQDSADVVCVRADRSPRLYLLREETFHNLLKRAKERDNGVE